MGSVSVRGVLARSMLICDQSGTSCTRWSPPTTGKNSQRLPAKVIVADQPPTSPRPVSCAGVSVLPRYPHWRARVKVRLHAGMFQSAAGPDPATAMMWAGPLIRIRAF